MSQDRQPEEILIGIDRKPWDFGNKIDLPPSCTAKEFLPPKAFKRQHEIVNTLVGNLSGPVVIMDDDYWFMSTRCMSKMLELFCEKSMVVPRTALHADTGTLFDEPVVEGQTIAYGSQLDGRTLTVVDDGHGHNPFAGHPKLILAEDFNTLGGFDFKSFPHYWWCDTDIWYRSRSVINVVEADIPVVHFHHPRYKQEMFQQQNSRTFLMRHKDNLTETHKRLLDVVIL